VLRQAAPMIDEEHPPLVAEARTDIERPEHRLPALSFAHGHLGEFALGVKRVEVEVEVADVAPGA
jgi:hypothetical protein